MTRIKLREPEGSYRRRIFDVFQRIYEKNDIPENDYKIVVNEIFPVELTWSKRPEGDHRHRILEVFTKIYEKNDLPENDYKIFAEKLMGVPALHFPGLNDIEWRRFCAGFSEGFCAAKPFKKRPRSISPEPREAGDPHVIDLTSEA